MRNIKNRKGKVMINREEPPTTEEREEQKILGLPMKAFIAIIVFGVVLTFINVMIAKGNDMSVDGAISYLSEEGYLTYAASDNFDLGNYKIVNLASGTANTDAVNKGQLDTQIATFDSNISTLNTNVSALNNNVDNIGSDIEGLQTEVESLQVVWTSINDIVSDTSSLDSRATALEGNITVLGNGINSLQNDIVSINTSLGSLLSNITAIDESITTLSESIVSIEERLDALEEEIPTLIAIPTSSTQGDMLIYSGGEWTRIAHSDIASWINATSP